MRVEVMQNFGLTVPFEQAGYYERAHHQALIEQIRGAITEGQLVAVCGAIGSGKTVLLQRLRQILKEDDTIRVSTSFALEKHRLGRADFITALWYDLLTEPPTRFPIVRRASESCASGCASTRSRWPCSSTTSMS